MNKQTRTISPLSGNEYLNNNSDDYWDANKGKLLPFCVDRVEAARIVGVSTSTFDKLVKDGRMPKPFYIDGNVRWETTKLIRSCKVLSLAKAPTDNPWNS